MSAPTRHKDKTFSRSFIPGGFYQNTVGHFGLLAGRTGCLPCPRGTYVELDKVPGKRQSICRVCPAGALVKRLSLKAETNKVTYKFNSTLSVVKKNIYIDN